jgi:hypothetical protein
MLNWILKRGKMLVGAQDNYRGVTNGKLPKAVPGSRIHGVVLCRVNANAGNNRTLTLPTRQRRCDCHLFENNSANALKPGTGCSSALLAQNVYCEIGSPPLLSACSQTLGGATGSHLAKTEKLTGRVSCSKGILSPSDRQAFAAGWLPVPRFAPLLR